MNTFNTFNLLFYLRPDRKKEESIYPIYMRITVDGKRAEVSTKRQINRDNWDSKASKAKGYKSEVKQLNQYLESLRTSVRALNCMEFQLHPSICLSIWT